MSYTADYEYGKQQEVAIFPILSKRCKGIKLMEDRFNHWDAESDKAVLEIKSRKMFSNSFPDTMISSKKVDKGFQESRAVGFVFNFYDKIYVCSLSEKFKTYKKKYMKVKSRDGISEGYEWKTLIPMEDLTCIHTKNLFIDDE